MIRGVSFSRVLAAAGSAAIVAACATLWLRLEVNSEDLEHRRLASGLEASLSAQISAKAVYDDARLEAMRSRVGRFRLQLGTNDTWDRLVRGFGEGWKAEVGPRDERNGFSIQYGVFRLKSPALADWPEIVERLKDSEALPGVGIVEFEMKTSGSREQRSLDMVRILVAVQTRTTVSSLAETK
jgi:hypothetical protein